MNIPNMLRYLNSCLRRCYKKKVTSPMALPLAAFSFWLMTTTGVEVTGIRMEHQVHVQPHMNVNIPPHPITHLTPPETLHWRNTNITFSRKLHHSMGPIHEYDELSHGIWYHRLNEHRPWPCLRAWEAYFHLSSVQNPCVITWTTGWFIDVRCS